GAGEGRRRGDARPRSGSAGDGPRGQADAHRLNKRQKANSGRPDRVQKVRRWLKNPGLSSDQETMAPVRRVIPCLVAVAGLMLVPSAQAKVLVYGSDLTAPANIVEAHGADSVFWNTSLANGGGTAAPADGQVTVVRVKGT